MSNSNPNIVVDSIIDHEGTKTETKVVIYPCSIRRYALLEKINSPFIDSTVKFDINTIIPSAYIFACDNNKLKTYTTKDINTLINDAFDWSESLEMSDIPQIIETVTAQMTAINKAAPAGNSSTSETTTADGKKKSLQ